MRLSRVWAFVLSHVILTCRSYTPSMLAIDSNLLRELRFCYSNASLALLKGRILYSWLNLVQLAPSKAEPILVTTENETLHSTPVMFGATTSTVCKLAIQV